MSSFSVSVIKAASASDVVLLFFFCCWLKWTLRSDVLVDVIYCLEGFTVWAECVCLGMLKVCLPNRINRRHVFCVLIDIKQFLYQGRFNWLKVIFGKWGNAKLTSGGNRFIVDDLYWGAKIGKRKHRKTHRLSLQLLFFDVRVRIVVGLRQSLCCQKQGWRLRQVHWFITSWWKRLRAKMLFSTYWTCLLTDGDICWQMLPHFVQKEGREKDWGGKQHIYFPMAPRTSRQKEK